MNVTLPNGTVLKNVPEGTSKEEVKEKAILAGLATEEDFFVPTPEPTFSERLAELPPYSQQVSQRYEEFSPREIISGGIPEYQRRAEIMREGKPFSATERRLGMEPSLSPIEATTLGISELARTGGELVGGALGILLPDAIRVGAETVWDEIKDAPFVSTALSALNKGYEVYAQWKEKYPADAEQFESAVDLGILTTPQASLAAQAKRAKREYNLNNIEEIRAGILRMMRPDNFEGAGEVIEVGPTRQKVYVPSDKEQTVNWVLETVEDINPNRSYTYNHQVVNSAVTEADKQLIAHIKRSGNPTFDTELILSDMISAIDDFSNKPAYKLLSPDAQKKAKEFASVALEMLSQSKGDALSLLEIRREFDRFLTAGQKKAYDPTVESAKTAAGQHVRDVLNQTLKDITDGDEAHHLLDRMHHLLIAKDRLREGRAKEGHNMFARMWDTLKKRAMLPGTALGLVATGGVAGQLLTESVLLGAGGGAALFTASRALTKKNRLKFYAATLSAMDKAITIYQDDKNILNALKADRMLLIDLIDETRKEEEEEE